MLRKFVGFVVTASAWDVPNGLRAMQGHFEAWRKEFDVQCCETEEEYIYRLGVFAAVDAEINSHNHAGHTWKMGHNAMSHMTIKEIEASRGAIPSLKEHPHCPLKHVVGDLASLPESVDWRGTGAVTPVKN